MLLKIDKESLSDMSINIGKEVENYKKAIDSIMNTIDSLNTCWQGSTYNSFIEKYNNNKKGIIESKVFLEKTNNILNNSLKNYTNLSEGVHYNE